MNTAEDRLRDAYEAAAQTVRPESVLAEGVRALDDRRRRGHSHAKRGWSRGRLLIPCAAAAAVIAVVAGTTVLTQHAVPVRDGTHGTGGGPATTGPVGTPGYFVAMNWTTHPSMFVVNAASGAKGQPITLPRSAGSLVGVATGDGRTFVAAVVRAGPCVTHLYKFGLSRVGHATAPTEITTVPGMIGDPWDMAVAGDGQTLAYANIPDESGCSRTASSHDTPNPPLTDAKMPGDLVVVNLATGRSKQWSFTVGPNAVDVYFGGVSLSEDGSSVAYGDWVVPTSAPEGRLTARGRMVAHAGEFGSSTIMNGLELAPDGKSVYFGSFRVRNGKPTWKNWQIRVLNLVTGRTSLVRSFPGTSASGSAVSPDPTGRYLLIVSVQQGGEGTPHLDRLDVATGQVTRLNASWGEEPFIAW